MPVNSTYNTYSTGMFRIGGLASGLDVDSIIQDLMRIEQMKVDRLKQERQLVEWRKEAYREITNLLRSFQDEFFNIIKTDIYMLSSNTYRTFSVTSSAEFYVTATANANAMEGTYTIANITSLAAPTIIKGTNWLFPDGKSVDSTLEQLGLVAADGRAEFSINGVKFLIGTPAEGEEPPSDIVVIDPTKTTMRQFMNIINTNNKAGVNLFYSSIEKRFILQTKATGAATDIALSDVTGTFLQDIGLLATGAEKIPGTDATVSFLKVGSSDPSDPSNLITWSSPTNTFTIDGITYTLKNTTPEGMAPITITVTQDVDKAYNAIKNFVDKYNELIDKINGKLNEERFRDYLPLTDAQKKEMSEKEIELWEQKAKSGLLRGDSILQNIVYSMRRALSDAVAGVGISLSSIGITTGSYSERGKLHIDEAKLKDALRNNPEQVMQLFIKKSSIDYSPNLDSTSRTQRYNESGLMYRIYDVLMDNIRTTRDAKGRKGILLEKAGIVGDITEFQNMMDAELKRLDKRIDAAVEAMTRQENKYWAQFTALEKAIQKMNAQSMWLMQQLGMYRSS
ncbi:flagellar hook-associated protein 2 [Caldicoprobacter guelmensis]|uniref:flagellar filament capping protein FliD n=1 Tax=Caldicoprobacter guelmensis TaxID=1170224 RepID=UPI00195A0920|nr:flagellar filament capping protein FliD [Caldicoprobacter guelmensis]MBM7582631.1 flagellar hook-associated protein 2 [Caldicoprobacter guelmensis]